MLLIYGLGNNHSRYLYTKHNVGRLLIEMLVKKVNLTWEMQAKFAYAKTLIVNQTVYFLYSLGYMNESGEVISEFINYFKLKPDDLKIFLLQDDSDQLETRLKLVNNGGSGGHKGVESVYKHLCFLGISKKSVWKLKIGIRPISNRLRSETFVLTKLSNLELDFVNLVADNLVQFLADLAQGNFTKAQNYFNSFSYQNKI
jgi:PTH1 family peptidyl-tRNA hydrolase